LIDHPLKKVSYDYENWEFDFLCCSLCNAQTASALVPFTSMVEWQRSLDQRSRAGLRIPHQW
jgi:hypothetical protein